MLRPTDFEKLKGNKSRYAVVMGVAKRAREIAEKAEQDGVILIEKPVSLAVADLTDGDYKIMMTEADAEPSADTEEA